MGLNTVFVASSSLALLVAVAALVREVRLRRSLQSLLKRILAHWRRDGSGTPTTSDRTSDAARADRRDRLR
jgi:hypothetical protein